MSRVPRTPVHWPRMKVRGRRNRAKLTLRRTHRFVIPHAVLTVQDGGQHTFEAVSTWEPGTFRIEHSSVRDGYGRIVPGSSRGRAFAAEPPVEPRPQFSMAFTVAEPGAFERLRSHFFGKAD